VIQRKKDIFGKSNVELGLANIYILVDTVFGYVSGKLMNLGSTDGKVVIGQQGSCQ